MPAEQDARFRFSHDRYMTAAAGSVDKEWDTQMMHFLIAKAVTAGVDYHDDSMVGSKALYMRSRHICLAAELIKRREDRRATFRDVLYQAGETACESGARSTGIYYLAHALMLLQDNPWDDEQPDVSYQETLQLFVRSAECYWHQGMYDEALSLIRTTFRNARDPCDMASSFILQSRVFAVRGDSYGAFQALKDCLSLLGVPIPSTTWEACDQEFQKVYATLQSIDKEELLARRPAADDRVTMTMGKFAHGRTACETRTDFASSPCRSDFHRASQCSFLVKQSALLSSHIEVNQHTLRARHHAPSCACICTLGYYCRWKVSDDKLWSGYGCSCKPTCVNLP